MWARVASAKGLQHSQGAPLPMALQPALRCCHEPTRPCPHMKLFTMSWHAHLQSFLSMHRHGAQLLWHTLASSCTGALASRGGSKGLGACTVQDGSPGAEGGRPGGRVSACPSAFCALCDRTVALQIQQTFAEHQHPAVHRPHPGSCSSVVTWFCGNTPARKPVLCPCTCLLADDGHTEPSLDASLFQHSSWGAHRNGGQAAASWLMKLPPARAARPCNHR